MNLHNPNRARLRASHHLLHGHVIRVRSHLREIRGRHRRKQRSHVGTSIPAISLIKCAGTNGSALFGHVARTQICTTSRLFTALSPALQHVSITSINRAILTSAMKFVHRLPRSLITTFGTALRRAQRTALLLRIVSTTSIHMRRGVRTIGAILRRVSTRRVPALLIVGGVSVLRSFRPHVSQSRRGGPVHI